MRHAVAGLLALAAALSLGAPAAAQDTGSPVSPAANAGETVFDGDYLTVGVGAAYVPSYDGSNDYVFTALPLIQGSIGGVGISPRAAGLALDFIPDRAGAGVNFALGPALRMRMSRAHQIKDPVVELLPKLDTAVEIGPSAGVSFPGVLNPYDSLALTVDVRWDVAGAHGGMVVGPSVSYTTPLSTGIAAIVNVGGEWANTDFMDYYYSIDAEEARITGLDEFTAKSGFRSVGGQILLGWDLDNDIRNGGLALFVVGSYSRLLGSAADTPFTADRGSADQWIGGGGIAYTF
jgi:outer membrane scaffolding protein for murein synthesis (MipA/OmpV family)